SETRARVWDISDGGFALWTSELVLVGAPTMFSVGPPGGSPRLLCAKAVYVLPASGGGYFSGWAGEGDEAMELLRDTMTRLAEPMPA
ncbi:MAG: hypothetical protein ABI051_06035, partial [Vicinamibacterales bacterium]